MRLSFPARLAPSTIGGAFAALACVAALLSAVPADAQVRRGRGPKLDAELTKRAARASGTRRSRVIVQLEEGRALPPALRQYQRGSLALINAVSLDVPDTVLAQMAAQGEVRSAHVDRPIWAADYLSTRSTAADLVPPSLGYTGDGVGVAVIDSGITSWHDDLTGGNGRRLLRGAQRVSKFVDFVGGHTLPYDDHGHGSHVAGIILGNGYDSFGKQAGIAPEASLVALKVLDQDGRGTVSNIIAALDWVVANARQYNIRVVNLSAGAAVTESYWTDPLTLAARRVAERGIVVVAAAGNLGKNTDGQAQYGGILSPGNAPWVVTVGASSTQGTVPRRDDQLAGFSSRGPTRGDYLAKPDLVAPGVGVRSLAVPGTALYQANQAFLVYGERNTANPPYLSLSGTSMAAPQVAGALALMFEANPALTPNFAKAILQYTAQVFPGHNALEQGAGFLDVLSAVRLSAFYAENRTGLRMPVAPSWSQHVMWGNHLVTGGYLNPRANAWRTAVVWGSERLAGAANGDDNIVWGTACGDCDNIVWGTGDASGRNSVWRTNGDDNIVWGTNGDDNIVWGTTGGDDNIVWGTQCGGGDCERVVWGSHGDDNIVWGTASGDDNIVWGTNGDDNIVWGTNGDDNLVWGTNGDDNIVWGTNGDDNIVWGTNGDDNIVWGTNGDDNIVWGTNGDDNIVWGTAAAPNGQWESPAFFRALWGPRGIFTLNWRTRR